MIDRPYRSLASELSQIAAEIETDRSKKHLPQDCGLKLRSLEDSERPDLAMSCGKERVQSRGMRHIEAQIEAYYLSFDDENTNIDNS